MELSDLIPDNSLNWVVEKNILFCVKYSKIPICYIEDETNIVFVSLDHRITKPVSKLIKHLISLDIEFYMFYPDLMNPKGVDDYKNKLIYHYFVTYLEENFRREFKKIGFDLIENLCKWCEKENCFELIKESYDDIKTYVNDYYVNWQSGDRVYCHSMDVRDDFNSLWREIQINVIL